MHQTVSRLLFAQINQWSLVVLMVTRVVGGQRVHFVYSFVAKKGGEQE